MPMEARSVPILSCTGQACLIYCKLLFKHADIFKFRLSIVLQYRLSVIR
jgi:hypothetical protein